MDTREFLGRLRRLPEAFGAWAAQFSFFTLAVLFALSGHLLFAIFLNGLGALGVDFAALDSSRNIVPALQVLMFAAQTGAVVAAIARGGVAMRNTLAGVASLLWAAGMLMITFVSAQCDLYGVCL